MNVNSSVYKINTRYKVSRQTSWYSTDSKMTHRCCHLMNKVENTDSTPDILYRPTMQWAVGGHLQAREMFPQNCHFPNLKNVSLGPPESTPQTASQSVQPFYHSWRLRPTDTDHTTSVTIGRILCFAQRCKQRYHTLSTGTLVIHYVITNK